MGCCSCVWGAQVVVSVKWAQMMRILQIKFWEKSREKSSQNSNCGINVYTCIWHHDTTDDDGTQACTHMNVNSLACRIEEARLL